MPTQSIDFLEVAAAIQDEVKVVMCEPYHSGLNKCSRRLVHL